MSLLMDVFSWAELRTAAHPAQGLHLFWHRMQTAILKGEEDSGVDSSAFTQDIHRHGAVPVGKKLQLFRFHWEINGDFTPVNCFPAGTIKHGVFFVVLVGCFVLFFKDCIKEHMLSMEDFCMKSINHSPVWFFVVVVFRRSKQPNLYSHFPAKDRKRYFPTTETRAITHTAS